MIFKNMEVLGISSVDNVVKVGDTVSDIKEGKNAGVFTVGVIEGSSELGLTQEEFEGLSGEEKEQRINKAAQRFRDAGADAVIRNMSGLLSVLE